MTETPKRGRPPHPDILTPAEWHVVQLAKHGLSNPQIAASMGISINAIKYHISNVISKLQLPNKQALLRWTGAPAESLYHGVNKMPHHIIAIGQISRTVSDIKTAVHWYREQLGLTHLYTYDKLAFFDCQGVRLFLSESPDTNTTDSIIYFKTDDIKSCHQTLSERGIEFSHAPHRVHQHEDGTEEWMAFFKDPDGQPLGLMAQIKPTA